MADRLPTAVGKLAETRYQNIAPNNSGVASPEISGRAGEHMKRILFPIWRAMLQSYPQQSERTCLETKAALRLSMITWERKLIGIAQHTGERSSVAFTNLIAMVVRVPLTALTVSRGVD
jgi:hypothetical protein